MHIGLHIAHVSVVHIAYVIVHIAHVSVDIAHISVVHFAYVSVHILHILVYILPMLPYQTIHTMSVYFIHTMCVCILPMSVCTLYNIHVNVPSAHVIY